MTDITCSRCHYFQCLFLCIVAAGSLLASPATAFGQGQVAGAIHGVVKDQDGGVVIGVALVATSVSAALKYTATSDPDGYYRLTNLAPGTYTVTAHLAGFAAYQHDDVQIGAGLTLGLDIVLRPATVSEIVEVVHTPPMLEVLRPGQTLNISGSFQRDVPLSRTRDWAQFFEVTPGITASTQVQVWQNYNFHASNSASHVLQLDGADVMSAQANSNIWVNLNTDAIADVQVKTSVADASIPLGVGAAANIVTYSGTNVPRGTAAVIYQARRWSDSNAPGGTAASTVMIQPSGTLGGPIVQDKVWFFSSYRYMSSATGIARSEQQLATLNALVNDFRAFDNDNRASFISGKLSYSSGTHDLTLVGQYDRNPVDGNTSTYGSNFSSTALGGPFFSAKLSSILTPATLSQLVVSYNKKGQWSTVPDLSLPSRVIYQRVNPSGGGLTGTNALATLDSTGVEFAFPESKVVISADVTRDVTRLGAHSFKIGAYLQHQKEFAENRYANNGSYLLNLVLRDPLNQAAGTIPFQRVTLNQDRVPRQDLRATDVAFYLQDLWRVTPRITVAGGIRFDKVKRHDRIFDFRVQDSLDVGPRFGGTVRLDAHGHSIVHGAVGRIHDALPLTAASTGLVRATRTDEFDVDLDGTFETTLVTPGATQQSANRRFDPEFHQPFVNEMTMGLRQQLPMNVALDLAWIRRTYRDQIANVEVNGLYEDGVFVGYRDESQDAITVLTNNRWNWPLYHGVTLNVARQGRLLQVFGGYTRQLNHLKGTWQPNDPSSFLQPDVFPDEHVMPHAWADHTVRLGATYRAPWSMQVAGNITVQTGRWSGPITTTIAAPDPRFGPRLVRLSTGREVSNPLATTTVYAYASRGAEQLRADTLQSVNVRIGRQFTLGRSTLHFTADIFNLTNAGADQGFASTNLVASNFGQGTNRQLPRSLQLGLRASF